MTNPFTPNTPPETALAWHRAGRGVALVTVIETWGSAPCPVGSQLVVSQDGAFEGSVSGGCVEGAVVLEAQEALADALPRLLTYGVSNSDAFAAGLACGGTIRLMVEPISDDLGQGLPVALLAELVAHRASRTPAVYQVNLATWAREVIDAPSQPAPVLAAKTGVVGELFSAVHLPPLRLFLVGAVHIAQILAPMAAAVGIAPTVIDPRGQFLTAERFPGVAIVNEDPEDILPNLGLDAHSAVVTLAHDTKIDDPALVQAIAGGPFYIGCLGSRRTHAARLARLRDMGVTDDQLARLHGPVGLDIGAMGPAEIAVSILAELIATHRGKRLQGPAGPASLRA